jgi:hypothetical protein
MAIADVAEYAHLSDADLEALGGDVIRPGVSGGSVT